MEWMGLGNMRKPAAYTEMYTVMSCRVKKDKSTRKLRGVRVFVHDQYFFNYYENRTQGT